MAVEEDKNKVSWNIAASQAQFVSGLIQKSIRFYLVGDLGQWYWHLTALREMVNYELSKNDRENLDAIEKEASQMLPSWKRHKRRLDGYEDIEDARTFNSSKLKAVKVKSSHNDFAATVKKYQRSLMDSLKGLGYFPNKEDRSNLGF